ncbi:MAG TPA: NADH-quinone oxidoreductase subunit L [bacterium]
MIDYIWLIPAFPLLGFFINGLFGPRFKERHVGRVAVGAIGMSFIAAIALFFEILSLPAPERVITRTIYTWIQTGNFEASISFLLDPLSMVMVFVVTGVGLLIHIYSIGYMHGDRGFARYFAFLNLFTFAMLILVLADNFLLLFVGWEGVGLCSYLLIGFWYEDVNNANAGKKAFIVNRIGDFGFLLGMFLIFAHFGSLHFNTVFGQLATAQLSSALATVIALLLFVGATGKSAQIPLFVWLPDAMAGPTPVSALIHAATMVTAGVYMLARCHAIFLQAPVAMHVVAIIGLATAFLAATIALVHTDIKKVLAYSTISQLGYMFLACGVGAFGAGIFHLTTHAYFKALLFLSAGSVMHALHNETDMTKMGGLKNQLPITYRVFLAGAMALAGVPFLSGFFSKDEILWKTVNNIDFHGFELWLVGVVVAGMTAFYTFRLIFMTFHGYSRVAEEKAQHIHESPTVMTGPLVVLAFLSIIGGWIGIPHYFNQFDHFLEPVFSQYVISEHFEGSFTYELFTITVSIIIAFWGIGLAYLFYVAKPSMPLNLSLRLKRTYNFLYHKWYVDELYDFMIVRPIAFFSDVLLWRWVDIKFIDGTINTVAALMQRLSEVSRRAQSGMVQNYALSLVIGVVLLIGYFLFK